ncbi:multidrug effflux MFS transporter [Ferrovibrio sp. MS7]|jgi:DHA1 family bicyclomycin/chloramphenicol resistance-like MFS transporter|uniref:multidrug effflux MFS transporter n=1 Tax=Ferrovibrio plantarum TaxID=3119164 RepID=UPI003135E864
MSALSLSRPSLAILIAMTALGPTALNIFMASMPGMVQVFNTDYGTIQLTLTLYLVGMASAQLAYGPISDRTGRRPALLWGLGIYIAGGLLCAAAWNVEVLIFGRLLQALGGCAGIVLSRAIVRDIYDRSESAAMIGYITMAMSLAPMFAPAIGGYLDSWISWRASFAVCMLFGGSVFLWAYLRLPETLKAGAETMPAGSIRAYIADHFTLLRHPAFRGYALQTTFVSGVFFSFITGAPFVVITVLKLPPSTYGLWFILVSLGYMLGNFSTGRLVRRLGTDRMFAAGAIISIVGSSLIALFGFLNIVTPETVFLPMAVVAVANGITLPNGIAGAISVNPKLAGTAAGLVGAMQMGMGAVATQIVGHWQDVQPNQFPMVLTMLGMSLAAGITCLISAKARGQISKS